MYSGQLRKMSVAAESGKTAQYALQLGEDKLNLNDIIGKKVELTYSGKINCIHCQTKTNKSFNQGYCYRCLISLARCDSCIIKPELCHYHEGTCREPEWGEENCFSPHFIYLANTGNLKVGITRHVTAGVSSRWIDQGATQAIPILQVNDRLTSGKVEVICKQHVGDKTNWRTMLKGEPEKIDLEEEKRLLLEKINNELSLISHDKSAFNYTSIESDPIDITFPVIQYPEKIKSLNLDKTPSFTGVLKGIKGQYWLLDDDRVINIRKFAGYNVKLSVSS
ncbi:DUF2797 domain-containing protein [Alteromonas sp. ASW11-130]|uniref:DUF2797 domain-containing protein n=1 Tax=Alteromonas sp. ASW11-130 TaxID=3015775 RepID=UPI002241CFD4|nr:DUF2797 domain-containing protein [Alteromonas sp. ASW11-130]MCW8092089.1 DUF2797 domain-containing protein [Alteromonas sp. ASW11-130]